MKRYLLIISLLLSVQLLAQPPILKRQNSYGGSKDDLGKVIRRTRDKGFIVGGTTFSPEVPGNHGYENCWVKKFDKKGKEVWSKCYGGSYIDELNDIIPTKDNGYIIAGYAGSDDGDATGNPDPISGSAWIFKIDSSGNIKWSRFYGGSEVDDANSIINTADGGYIFAGQSASADGDVPHNQGAYDLWVVKLDISGNIQWSKTYGGYDQEYCRTIKQVEGDGYIIGAATTSSELPGHHNQDDPGTDIYILKIAPDGSIQWQKCFGGSFMENGGDILPLKNDGYIFVGTTSSVDGDVLNSHNPGDDDGIYDLWLVKISLKGVIQWQKCYGGYDLDYGNSIEKTSDGGYVMTGFTSSNDGDVSGNHGGYDAWVLKVDSLGKLKWQKCFGGTKDEYASSITPDLNNGDYVFAGKSNSKNGDCTKNYGLSDMWVVRLGDSANTFSETNAGSNLIAKENENALKVYPNPTQNNITVSFFAESKKRYSIIVYDLNGKEIMKKQVQYEPGLNKINLNLNNFSNGTYFIKLYNEGSLVTQKKIIKQSNH